MLTHTHLFILTLLLTLFGPQTKTLAEPPVFKLHVSAEPLSIDPSQQKGSGAMFLMNTLTLPLFRSDLGQPFQPGALKSCRWANKKTLSCQLSSGIKWSNGKAVSAEDIKRTFTYWKEPATKAARVELLDNIREVEVKSSSEVQFHLINEEPRFQERLTSPLLGPIASTQFPKIENADQLVTAGPYKVEKWEIKKRIRLTPNAFYQGHPQRPPVEFYFIPEETTALLLYQTGKLDFLRRLPTAYLKSYEGKPELHQSPLIRFDYIGFGPALENQPELRKILSESLRYEEWQKMLSARGRPGCFGIGKDLIKSDPCVSFNQADVKAAKEWLKKNKIPKLEIHYSTLGGEDHKRSMEWAQSEWKKNLDLYIAVKGLDNALFQKELMEAPPTMFRFGVALEHLSCANALKSFLHSPNRPLPFKQEPLLSIVRQLQAQKPSQSDAPLCEKALLALLEKHWIIPLGRIHTSLLVKPEWKGWQLTALNVLDLSNLHWEK